MQVLLDNDKVDRNRIGVYLGCGEKIQDFHHLIYTSSAKTIAMIREKSTRSAS